jgi:hypothetical protein
MFQTMKARKRKKKRVDNYSEKARGERELSFLV